MTSSEIMPNDILVHNGRYVKITSVTNGMLSYGSEWVPVSEFSPVPVTETTFKGNGFNEQEENVYTLLTSNIRFSINQGNLNPIAVYRNESRMACFPHFIVSFVHELQNVLRYAGEVEKADRMRIYQ